MHPSRDASLIGLLDQVSELILACDRMTCAAMAENLHRAVTPFGLPITDVQMVMPILCLHLGYRHPARLDQRYYNFLRNPNLVVFGPPRNAKATCVGFQCSRSAIASLDSTLTNGLRLSPLLGAFS
jgi:hypothetical protein